MPINNSYSQTPKRIFTNKPFIKGMNYTNADLEPYVCRAVANLELESSNSATRLRSGTINSSIGNAGSIAYKLYNKLIIFSAFMNEFDYKNNIYLDSVVDNSLTVVSVDDKDVSFSFYDEIITSSTELEWDGSKISIKGDTSTNTFDNCVVVALRMDEGDIPHCVNGEDYSFSFIGAIYSKSTPHTLLYKGLLKIYYHVAANKMLLEKVKPTNVDYSDISGYGVNLIAHNPAVYKDWVTFTEHDYYADYFGGMINDEKYKPIAVVTTALYDAEVPFSPYNNPSNAKLLKSVDSNSRDTFYIRPYYVLPNDDYSAIVVAKDSQGIEYAYNFTTNVFELNPTTTDTNTTTNSISFEDLSLTNNSTYNRLNTIEDTSSENFVFAYSGTNLTVLFEPYELSASEINSKFPSANVPMFDNTYDAVVPYKYTVYEVSKCSHANQAETPYTRRQIQQIIELKTMSETKWTRIVETTDMYSLPGTLYATKSVGVHVNTIDIYKSANNNFVRVEASYTQPNEVSALFGVSSRTPIEHYQHELQNNNTANISLMHYDASVDGGEFVSIFEGALSAVYDNTKTYSSRSGNSYTVSYKKDEDDPSDAVTSTTDISLADYGQYEYAYTTFLSNFIYTIEHNSSGDPLTIRIFDSNGNLTDTINGYNDPTAEYKVQYGSSVNVKVGLRRTVYSKETLYNTSTSVSNDANKILYPRLSYSLAADNSINIKLDITKRINKNIISAAANHTITGTVTSIGNSTTFSDFTNLSVSDIESLFSSSGVTHTSSQSTVSGTFTYKFSYMPTDICHKIIDTSDSSTHPSIPIVSSAASSIDTSTVYVKVFKPETFTINNVNYIRYRNNQFTDAHLYTFGTSKKDYVDYSEITSNSLFSKPVRMCNHIGHTVIWGDYTNSKSLYYSEYGNPAYFPSNWVLTFDNPIVYAYPHKGDLIVFTTDDVYMLFNGNVPAASATSSSSTGTEVAFTQKLIQANTRLGKSNINTVRSIGKDVFFINNNNNGYLLKANKYVNDQSDVYLVKITNQIDDLLENPYTYALERFIKWKPTHTYITDSKTMNVIPIYESSIDMEQYVAYSASNITVIDGDTIDITVNESTTRYRLADIDTPEITNGKNERLGNLAKSVLEYLINHSESVYLYDTGDVDSTESRRHIAYLSCLFSTKYVSVNATMLYNGLAKFFDERHDPTGNKFTLDQISHSCAVCNKRGLFNNLSYTDTFTFDISNSLENPVHLANGVWDYNVCDLYTYATNSYVYIFQSIQLDLGNAITIVYKYNIDSKVWITYDILGYINPADIITTNSKLGFNILTNNLPAYTMPSILEFAEQKKDSSNVAYNTMNDYTFNYVNSPTLVDTIINAYFDSGNQSISLMNDKLFREIKLMLGALPDDLLTLDYSIDLYTDGKLVVPNQIGSCNSHIHHRPINTHYKGRTENLDGFQKVTFFAPARGRIPRIVFSINCESDINILEYAIVYMQLNAK